MIHTRRASGPGRMAGEDATARPLNQEPVLDRFGPALGEVVSEAVHGTTVATLRLLVEERLSAKVKDQAERAQTYKDSVHGCLRHPQFVGCHWFKYQDEPTTGRSLDGEKGTGCRLSSGPSVGRYFM